MDAFPAVILAGGAGTRLHPLIPDIPKPMAPIAGKPFLEHLIRFLSNQNITDIILCTGYKKKYILEYFQDGAKMGVNIQYSDENTPLGTGGALKKASLLLKGGNFFLLNGDSFFCFDMRKLITHHHRTGAMATMAVAEVRDTSRFGRVTVSDDGMIVGFSEKSDSGRGLINAGIYLCSTKIIGNIPSGKSSLENEILPALLPDKLFAVPSKGFFVDIGIPEDYLRLSSNPKSLLSCQFLRQCIR